MLYVCLGMHTVTFASRDLQWNWIDDISTVSESDSRLSDILTSHTTDHLPRCWVVLHGLQIRTTVASDARPLDARARPISRLSVTGRWSPQKSAAKLLWSLGKKK